MNKLKVMGKIKAKVAFFDFACCEGCQIELTNYGDKIFLNLLEHIEIVEFREAMSEKTSEVIDIACIEGSYTRDTDMTRLQSIRDRSKTVIAYGQCAATAGINALKNHQLDYQSIVYGHNSNMPHLQSGLAKPISAAIKVDYQVLGCPMNRYEFLDIISHLLHGKEPVIPNYPVCVECKRNETICRYHSADKGDGDGDGDESANHCLGMLARAGCGAPCPADGIPCEACRGFVDNPNQQALEKVLMESAGFSQQRAQFKSRLFNANERKDSQL
jgi:sulfhydrogenase subunit delta